MRAFLLFGTILPFVSSVTASRSFLTSFRQTVLRQTTTRFDNLLSDIVPGAAGEQAGPAALFSVKPGKPIKTTRIEDDTTVLSLSNVPGYSLQFKQPRLCDTGVKQYSGYLNVGKDKHFFFWFFESRHKPVHDPLLLWLNGGPGCSSMTGLFMELGPCSITDEGNDTRINPNSWNSRANVIFLDQPLNVGYSYGKETRTSDDAAKDVYAFLQLFNTAFPRYSHNDFHLFGESYGGHYVPAIGDEIRRQNHRALEDGYHAINLKSIGIGNGLTDPLIQYKYYATMACNSSYGPVLDEDSCQEMQSAYATCARLINVCYRYSSPFTCVPPTIYCNRRILGPYSRSGRNPYDVRKKCPPNTPLCYTEIENIQKYLNLKSVQKELGAKVDKFENCNTDTYERFTASGDWMRPYVYKIPKILEDGIRVLIYAGDADFICNWYGNKAWVTELEWFGKAKFNAVKDKAWRVNGKKAGEARESGPLTFLRIYKAGHMVPYDQPTNSLSMLNYWLDGRSLISGNEDSDHHE